MAIGVGIYHVFVKDRNFVSFFLPERKQSNKVACLEQKKTQS